MSYQYTGNPFMSSRIIEIIRELREYLGPKAEGLSDEDVVHRVMCQALDDQMHHIYYVYSFYFFIKRLFNTIGGSTVGIRHGRVIKTPSRARLTKITKAFAEARR